MIGSRIVRRVISLPTERLHFGGVGGGFGGDMPGFWWCRCPRLQSCCCGFSLEQGSLAIAIAGIVIGVLSIFSFVITFTYGPNYVNLAYGIVQLAARWSTKGLLQAIKSEISYSNESQCPSD